MKIGNKMIIALLILGAIASYMAIASWWNIKPKKWVYPMPWLPKNCKFYSDDSIDIGSSRIRLALDELKLASKEEDEIIVVYYESETRNRGVVEYWKPHTPGVFYYTQVCMPEAENAWATEWRIKFNKASRSFTYTPLGRSYNLFYFMVFFWAIGGFILASIWAKIN